MQFRSYQKEIQRATTQVLDLFNNVIIDRRKNDDKITNPEIKVPCFYGQRSRVLKSLEDRNRTIELPLMCLTIGNVTRDARRVHDLHNDVSLQNDQGQRNYLALQPVPVDITYNLEILAKYQQDLDQIMSNFVVFFNPTVYIVIPHPLKTASNLKLPVNWDGNLSLDLKEAVGDNEDIKLSATTTFTVKTWFFPGHEGTTDILKRIHSINFIPSVWEDTENGVVELQNWYAVPPDQSFKEFEGKIVLGKIKPEFYDKLPLAAGTDGYWDDIKRGMAVCLPEEVRKMLEAKNPKYIVSNKCELLFLEDKEAKEGTTK